jgi:lysophospholipase L1-like esterase
MFIIRNPNAATQMDFEVYGFSLYAGSVDLDASDPREAGHIMFGQGVGQNTVATGTGTVRFNGATHGVMQLPSSAPLGNVFSVVYIAKTFGSPSASSFNSLWGGSIGNASSTTALGLRTLTNQFGLEYSGAMVTPVQPTGEIYEPGNTFGGVAVSYDGSTGKLYSNGLLTGSLAVTKASFVLKDIFVGCMNNSGTIWYSNYELAAMAIFPRVLTDAEQLQAYKYLKSQLSSQGVTIPDTRVLIYEGDSITYGSGAANTQGYPYLAASQMTRGERGPNYGVFGSKFADMNARLPTVTAMIDRAVADGRTPIVHFDIGSNDFVLGVSASTLYNQVKGYAATCRAHGAKVIAGTVLSRPEAGVDAIRNAYNPMLAAGVGVDFDGVTNFGTTAMGVDGAWSNTTNFAGDQVHPTSAGYAIMAPVAAAAVNALP